MKGVLPGSRLVSTHSNVSRSRAACFPLGKYCSVKLVFSLHIINHIYKSFVMSSKVVGNFVGTATIQGDLMVSLI